MRLAASPGSAAEFFRMLGDTRHHRRLADDRVPTLVLHRARWRDAAERVTALILGRPRCSSAATTILPGATMRFRPRSSASGAAGARPRPRQRPHDCPLHGHRRLDRTRCCALRPRLARSRRTAPRFDEARARPLPRGGARHRGRRLLRHLRRAGPRDPLRSGGRRQRR
jgi:hypothetical protein